MNQRDKAIINDLRLFRMMSRNQIIELHFKHLKNPINSCNSVLKRLTRDNHIKCSTLHSPYVYFNYDCNIKPDSTKIPHFLELVDTVIAMKAHREPKNLMIEPKYGDKGTIEPDIFAIWYQPIFVEVQRNLYTKEVMQKKIDLYEEYFVTGDWKDEPWQKIDKKVFPSILIITSTRYAVKSTNLKIYQSPSISDFIESMSGESKLQIKPQPVKSVIQANGGSLKLKIAPTQNE